MFYCEHSFIESKIHEILPWNLLTNTPTLPIMCEVHTFFFYINKLLYRLDQDTISGGFSIWLLIYLI